MTPWKPTLTRNQWFHKAKWIQPITQLSCKVVIYTYLSLALTTPLHQQRSDRVWRHRSDLTWVQQLSAMTNVPQLLLHNSSPFSHCSRLHSMCRKRRIEKQGKSSTFSIIRNKKIQNKQNPKSNFHPRQPDFMLLALSWCIKEAFGARPMRSVFVSLFFVFLGGFVVEWKGTNPLTAAWTISPNAQCRVQKVRLLWDSDW